MNIVRKNQIIMNIVKRITQFCDHKGVSKNEFSSQMGLSNSYMSKMMGPKNSSVGSKIIEKIVRAYPEINLRWLITGEGEMLIDPVKNELPVGPCQQCNLRERLLHTQENLIDRLQERLEELNQLSENKE
jgi:DNA-binding Xre family transcriptional regulator